jgi:hypothetical protein
MAPDDATIADIAKDLVGRDHRRIRVLSTQIPEEIASLRLDGVFARSPDLNDGFELDGRVALSFDDDDGVVGIHRDAQRHAAQNDLDVAGAKAKCLAERYE